MARPIPLTLPARDPRAALNARLQEAPAEHAEAILSAFEVLQGLRDRGVLDLLRGALGSSDQVIEIAVEAMRSPQSVRGIRNLLLLVNMLGEIDPEQLAKLTKAVPQALQAATRQPEQTGFWKPMHDLLMNQNARRGLSALASMLEAVGANLAPAPVSPLSPRETGRG